MTLGDNQYAEYAARHGFDEAAQWKVRSFEKAGIKSFSDAKERVLEVRNSFDTKCYRDPYGREIYANDRLNTIHISNEKRPDRSTLYINDRREKGIKATDRLEKMAAADRHDHNCEIVIRQGGAKALEQDRQAVQKSRQRQHQGQRPGETIGSASKPRDQAAVLKTAQDKQRETPDQKLTPEQRRTALQEASAAVAKDQERQKKAWEAETDPKKKEQMALKAGIEQADFKRQAARENADLTIQEKGAQSSQALKAKSNVRAADKAYNQGLADWHKRSVRDSSYEPFDKRWSKEVERAKARESKSKDPQEKKDAALERQFNSAASHGKGHGM